MLQPTAIATANALPVFALATPAATLPWSGLPGDRAALSAAERAFAQLKLSCLAALAHVPEPGTERLHRQVQLADEVLDLWLLRAPLLAALQGPQPERKRQRQLLRRSLDAVFNPGMAADSSLDTGFDSHFGNDLAPL